MFEFTPTTGNCRWNNSDPHPDCEARGDAKNECMPADVKGFVLFTLLHLSESKREAVQKYMQAPRFPFGKTPTNLEPCCSPCLVNIGGFGRCQRLSVLEM
jgi:hypothetical protein